MKAEELMIGDWVHYRGTNIQVTSLYNKGGSNEIGWSDKESVWVNGRTVEPIPLTPEILEKNRFIHYTVTDFYMWKEESSEPIHLDNYNENGWMLRINCDNIPCECKYVHQLQHALRLCGINKEIVL